MTIKNLNVLGFIAASIFSSSVLAAEDFRSADFAFDSEALLSKVETKSLVDKSAVLYCRADISIAGKAERVSCYSNAQARDLVSQSEAALASLPFDAAEVEGTKVPVRMSFRVAYAKVAEEMRANLIPNIGTMQAKYGRNYVAPQERLDLADWYERYSENSGVVGKEFLGDGAMSRVSATVTESGKPSMLKTLDAEKAYARDANVVKVSLKHARFIPGTLNGKVVPMQYMVAVHYQDSAEAVANAD